MNSRALLPAVFALFGSACLVVDSGNPNPGPGPGPGGDTCATNPALCPAQPGCGVARPPASTPVSTVIEGVAAPDPNTMGYIITAAAGRFRITWAGPFSEFCGSVFADAWEFTQPTPGCMDGSCSLDGAEDRVEINATDKNRVDFISGPVSGKRSGFEMAVPLGKKIYINFLINGAPQPMFVSFVSGDTDALASALEIPLALLSVPLAGSRAGRPDNSAPMHTILAGAGVGGPDRAGYILTANTGTFRVTWTGARVFRGSFFADPGQLSKFFPGCTDGSCSLAGNEDQVVLGNGDRDRVDFISYPVSGKRSGFDVQITGSHAFLDLLVEGQRDTSRVVFISADTRMAATPQSIPFGLLIR